MNLPRWWNEAPPRAKPRLGTSPHFAPLTPQNSEREKRSQRVGEIVRGAVHGFNARMVRGNPSMNRKLDLGQKEARPHSSPAHEPNMAGMKRDRSRPPYDSIIQTRGPNIAMSSFWLRKMNCRPPLAVNGIHLYETRLSPNRRKSKAPSRFALWGGEVCLGRSQSGNRVCCQMVAEAEQKSETSAKWLFRAIAADGHVRQLALICP
jgi:hypothetical protein